MKRLGSSAFLLFVVSACSIASPWKLDTISAGDSMFSSARLTYREPGRDSPLRLDFIRLGSAVDLFLSISQFTLSPSPAHQNQALVRLRFGTEPPFEEAIPILEGNMRLRFPSSLTEKIIQALQEGKEVAILVDGIEEKILPERFTKLFEQLTGKSILFRNPFKGPME